MAEAFDKLGQGVKISELAREKRKHTGFLADLMRGRASCRLLFPWPEETAQDKARREAATAELKEFLTSKVDPEFIDLSSDIPSYLFDELSRLGFFALKVPEAYGGKELSEMSYSKVMGLAASYSSAVTIIISADNTIGVKFPVLKYGTEEQKKKYLPELTRWPSGFCFTERHVGSDPARMRTYALRVKDEQDETIGYKITGEKWYTTNSALKENVPLAKYLAVVAKIVDSPDEAEASHTFGIFIVPTASDGVSLGPRNHFCGMHGIYNANPKFTDVYVASEHLIGKEGEGFKIALEALNTGRIAIAAGCLASSKQAFVMMRWWANERQQWGKPIGQHEAIGSGMLVPAAANIFAMEAITEYAAWLTDQGKDARLAAAAAKVFASERAWTIVDNTMQVFGGRGYETYVTLSPRETTAPVERLWRDSRPNRIFEGSTQVLSQWFLREALDEFLKSGEVFLKEGRVLSKIGVGAKFALAYLTLFIPRPADKSLAHQALGNHLVFIEQTARELARTIIVYSGKYQAKLMFKQLTMERFFWIAVELFAMTSSIAKATHLASSYDQKEAVELADIFCREAKRNIRKHFTALSDNDDELARKIAKKILQKGYHFLTTGIIPAVKD